MELSPLLSSFPPPTAPHLYPHPLNNINPPVPQQQAPLAPQGEKEEDGGNSSPRPLQPFLNLLASHHRAKVLPTNAGPLETTVEISLPEMSDNSLSATDDRMDTKYIDRTLPGVNSDTSMGAVTLIAFLNLLGYIQNVMASSSGRKKRSAPNHSSSDLTHRIPVPPVTSIFEEIARGFRVPWMEESEEKGGRGEDAVEDLAVAESRIDRPWRRYQSNPRSYSWTNFLSYLGQRFLLASNVMNFLTDPTPSRVRRDLEHESDQDRAERIKRFTTSMNAWYDELAGQNYDGKPHHAQNGGKDLISSLMLGLGRQFLGR